MGDGRWERERKGMELAIPLAADDVLARKTRVDTGYRRMLR